MAIIEERCSLCLDSVYGHKMSSCNAFTCINMFAFTVKNIGLYCNKFVNLSMLVYLKALFWALYFLLIITWTNNQMLWDQFILEYRFILALLTPHCVLLLR